MMDPIEDLYISPNKKIYSHTEMTQIPIIQERERERERERLRFMIYAWPLI